MGRFKFILITEVMGIAAMNPVYVQARGFSDISLDEVLRRGSAGQARIRGQKPPPGRSPVQLRVLAFFFRIADIIQPASIEQKSHTTKPRSET